MEIKERKEMVQEITEAVYNKIIKAMEEKCKNDEEQKNREAAERRLSDEEAIKKAMRRK